MKNYPCCPDRELDPPDPMADVLADEAAEQARLDYLQDWIDGTLSVEEAYSEPCAALADEPCIFELVGATSDDEILAAAKEVRGALIREILGRAE